MALLNSLSLWRPTGPPKHVAQWVNNFDDGAIWQYRSSFNINLAASLTYPIEKWGTWSSPDEAAVWQGSPRQALNLELNPPATAQTYFFNNQYNAWLDDAPVWIPPLGRTNFALFLPKPTAIPARWNQHTDDASVWTAVPPQLNLKLFLPRPAAFPAQWNEHINEASLWTGVSGNLNFGLLLPQPTSTPARWNEHFDDASVWTAIPPQLNLKMLLPKPVSIPQWNSWSNSDDATVWQYKPPVTNFALLLPKPASVPQWKVWSNADDSSLWTATHPTLNFGLLLPKPVAIPSRTQFTDDAPAWYAASVPRNAILLQPSGPSYFFINKYPAGPDDPANWTPQLQRLNFGLLLPKPTAIATRAQFTDDAPVWIPPLGRTNFALFLPKPTAIATRAQFTDDPAVWQYQLPYNLALVGSLTYLFPAYPLTFIDDPDYWKWQPLPNTLLNPPSPAQTYIFRNKHNTGPDDPANWQYRPPFNLSLAATITYPVKNWGVWSSADDPGVWQWTQPPNIELYPPGPSQSYVFRNSYNTGPDDPAVWLPPLVRLNFGLLLPKPSAIAARPNFGLPDDTSWIPPLGRLNFGLLLPKPTAITARPTFGLPDDTSWIPPFGRLNFALLLPKPTAIATRAQFGDDPRIEQWQWRAPTNFIAFLGGDTCFVQADFVQQAPQWVQPCPGGIVEWLIRARRRGRR